jgi:sodium-dependent dicarboxylate transporter 2/3/5
MWISNTATALIMLPVALAILQREGTQKLAVPLMLAIAWSANIGGIATPIGTPPNLIFMAVYEQQTGNTIAFAHWMLLGVPVSLTLLVAAWGLLCFGSGGQSGITLGEAGRWTPAQKRVLMVFALAAVLWITRTVPFGGWRAWTGIEMADDSTVALLCVVLLFLVPRGGGEEGRLLDWKRAESIQWGLLLLFAGGIAIARAFGSSGLSETIGESLGGVATLPTIVLVLLIALAVTFLTEVTSNTASTALLMPILAGVALAADVEPALMMIPAALSASCAFMLPVATPPNAVVFGSDRITIAQMARRGVILNVIGAILITLLIMLLLDLVVPL